MRRKCDCCKKEYEADERALKRGWGKTCSKSCAAKMRESGKPKKPRKPIDYHPQYGNYYGRRTSEGYKIYGNTAVDEWDNPVYRIG